MERLRENLATRVEALGREVDRLRARADELETGWRARDTTGQRLQRRGLPARTETARMAMAGKRGSGSAEMHGSREERRAARLLAVGVPEGGVPTVGMDERQSRRLRLREQAAMTDGRRFPRSREEHLRELAAGSEDGEQVLLEDGLAQALAPMDGSDTETETGTQTGTGTATQTGAGTHTQTRTGTRSTTAPNSTTPSTTTLRTNALIPDFDGPIITINIPTGELSSTPAPRRAPWRIIGRTTRESARRAETEAAGRDVHASLIVVDDSQDQGSGSGFELAGTGGRSYAHLLTRTQLEAVIDGRDGDPFNPPVSVDRSSMTIRPAGRSVIPAEGITASTTARMVPDVLEREQMTSRGRLVVERARASGGFGRTGRTTDVPAPVPAPAPAVERSTMSDGLRDVYDLALRVDQQETARLEREEAARDAPPAGAARRWAIAHIRRAGRGVVGVDAGEFPTPAEAARVQVEREQSATILEDAVREVERVADVPVPASVADTFGDQALAELRALQNTVTRLNDRMEIARSNMAMLAAARSSLREHEENVERMAGSATRILGSDRSGQTTRAESASRSTSANQNLARRPSFPYPRNPAHPHHRPRLGSTPIALVMNMDNMNSFDINFDGNIVYRPISAREPDRELIARCLSMLPGGRDGTPSRWMRLTGNGNSRPRRAGTSAGYWVRWISEDVEPGEGLRHRSLDMTALPRITAFDFAVSPEDFDCFVRADEIEFYTPRTRLHPTVGPWMHSRVRVEPFDNDPHLAPWGTSAHVRQAVQQIGGLPEGHYMRYHLRERRVEAHRPGDRSRQPTIPTSRAALERVLDSYESLGMGMTSDSVPAVSSRPSVDHLGETDDPDTAWLMSYEPAIGQIRASWRAHYRRTRDQSPEGGAAVSADPSTSTESERGTRNVPRGTTGLFAGSPNAGTPSNELWSRDYLDEDGVPLPALPVNQVVQSIRDEQSLADNQRRRNFGTQSPAVTNTGSGPDTPTRITYV